MKKCRVARRSPRTVIVVEILVGMPSTYWKIGEIFRSGWPARQYVDLMERAGWETRTTYHPLRAY